MDDIYYNPASTGGFRVLFQILREKPVLLKKSTRMAPI